MVTVPCREEGATPEFVTLNDVLIYPNPSSGTFNLDFTNVVTEDVRIECTDMQGRYIEISLDKVSSEQYTIGGMAAGVYMLTFRSGEHVTTKRIVKL